MANRRPTMNDVAKLAGVTQATVSYVINNSANISDEVKERVYDAISQLNYSPNYNARALKTNSSNIIGIILPDIVNQYYSRMVESFEKLLIKENFHTMVYTTSYNPDYEKDIIHKLLAMDVCGIIVLYQLTDSENWNILKGSGKKIIALEGGVNCSEIGIPNVRTDNQLGGYAATEYLIKQGAKRIAFIHQTAVSEALLGRFNGYSKAMKDAGLFHAEDIYYTENIGDLYTECVKVGEQIINKDYDGIVATSDLLALGLIRYFKNNNISVPEDIRIVGYDNLPMTTITTPSLTTIAQPSEEICQKIVEMIFADTENIPQSDISFAPNLIIRET